MGVTAGLGGDSLEKQWVPERVLPIRRIRGWVGAEPERPRAAARGYPEPLLRSSIRMACSKRILAYSLQPQLRSSPITHVTAKGNVLFLLE